MGHSTPIQQTGLPQNFFENPIEHSKTCHLKNISNISPQFLIFVNYGTFLLAKVGHSSFMNFDAEDQLYGFVSQR